MPPPVASGLGVAFEAVELAPTFAENAAKGIANVYGLVQNACALVSELSFEEADTHDEFLVSLRWGQRLRAWGSQADLKRSIR